MECKIIYMKKYKKFELNQNQLLSEEDMNSVIAGNQWIQTGNSWLCACNDKDDICYQIDYYTIFKKSGPDTFEPMPPGGIICDPASLIGEGRIYTVWSCEGVYNNNKTHRSLGRYRWTKMN